MLQRKPEVLKPTVGTWKKLARPKILHYFVQPSMHESGRGAPVSGRDLNI
eukprot:SAG11_NODE_3115_length_2676_cov_7.504075_2_plen_50_part_00